MVKKSALRKIGIFMLTAVLAVAPIMAVNAESAGQMAKASTGTVIDTTDPGHGSTSSNTSAPSTTSSVAPAASGGVVSNFVVTNAAGQKLVSTVPGVYSVTCVPGVAITTPASELPKGMTVEVRNSTRGDKAAQSIQDGLAILAQSGVSAVKGPEIDALAYIQGASKDDLEGKVTMCIGIPKEFKQAGYDYAVMLIQTGGRVSILPDTLPDDPDFIAVNTSGFGVYVIVKAPAGSFKMFK